MYFIGMQVKDQQKQKSLQAMQICCVCSEAFTTFYQLRKHKKITGHLKRRKKSYKSNDVSKRQRVQSLIVASAGRSSIPHSEEHQDSSTSEEEEQDDEDEFEEQEAEQQDEDDEEQEDEKQEDEEEEEEVMKNGNHWRALVTTSYVWCVERVSLMMKKWRHGYYVRPVPVGHTRGVYLPHICTV